jgi:tetratricopeptide (TPR) repeat protein
MRLLLAISLLLTQHILAQCDLKLSQKAPLDSLFIKLTCDKTDTTKVKIGVLISQAYIEIGAYDSALYYAEAAIALSEKIGYKSGIISTYFQKGVYFEAIDNHIKAIELFNIASKKAQSDGNFVKLAQCYNNIGNNYMNMAQYDKSIEYFNLSLKIREQLKDDKGIARVYNNIGNVYLSQSNYKIALDYFLKSMVIKEKLNVKPELINAYHNMGAVYLEMRDYDKSINYFRKSLNISNESKNATKAGNAATALATVKQIMLQYDSAFYFYRIADRLYAVNNNKTQLDLFYRNYGDLYLSTNKPDSAIFYFNKALSCVRTSKNSSNQCDLYNALAKMYNKQRRYEIAIAYLDSAVVLLKNFSAPRLLMNAYGEYAISHEGLGDYKKAYSYHVKFKNQNDSIYNLENSKELSSLKTQYEVDKKAAELSAKAEAEKLAQKAIDGKEQIIKNIIIVSIAIILIVVIIFTYITFMRLRTTRKQKSIIEIQKLLVDEKQKEILDSIHYAKRIQDSLLPTEKYIERKLKEQRKN